MRASEKAKRTMFSKGVEALTKLNFATEDEIKYDYENFILSVNIIGKSLSGVENIKKILNTCQYYYRVDDYNTLIDNGFINFTFKKY